MDLTWDPNDPLLRPRQVAALLGVDTKTVTRWARSGKLEALRTLGGHRRFRASVVLALRTPEGQKPPAPGEEATV
jgi:excisionase family DNA binding protein